jgi:hypothetical protein
MTEDPPNNRVLTQEEMEKLHEFPEKVDKLSILGLFPRCNELLLFLNSRRDYGSILFYKLFFRDYNLP